MWRKKSRVEWLIAVSVVVTLGFCAICATILWEVRRGVSDRAIQSTANLIAALKSDIERNVELYDLSLQAVSDGMNLPQISVLSPEIRQMLLFDRAATAKFLGSISVLDPTGKVILDSSTLRPQPAVFADQEYFTVHRDNPKAGLFMKGPMTDALGENVISISRRITRADGSFGGVVLGTLRLAYFQNLFTKNVAWTAERVDADAGRWPRPDALALSRRLHRTQHLELRCIQEGFGGTIRFL